MLICIPGCGICIPLEQIVPFLLLFLWKPLAALLGWDKPTDAVAAKKKDDDSMACCSGTAGAADITEGEISVLEDYDAFSSYVNTAKTDGKLLVVKFTATWCGPCKAIKPVVKRLALANPDVIFAEVDVDTNDETSEKQGIKAMPTFVFYRDGKRVKEMQGADAAQLESLVATYKK